MIKLLLPLALVIFFACSLPDYEKKQANSPSPVPGIQKRIWDKKAYESDLYIRERNDIRKNERQAEFYKWMNSYFKDSLKGKITGFYVTLDQLRIGQLPNTYYLFADFTTDDRLHLKIEEDVPTVEKQRGTALYRIMKGVNEKQKIHLFGRFVKIEDPDATEQDPFSLSYPSISILIDSIKN